MRPSLRLRPSGRRGRQKGFYTRGYKISQSMASTFRDLGGDEEDDIYVPEGVMQGIEDIAAGRTADEDDLDDALNF